MAKKPNLIEMDGEKCRAIVASLRTYLQLCDEANTSPKLPHIRDIAHLRDMGTKAMFLASQIGAEDDDDDK